VLQQLVVLLAACWTASFTTSPKKSQWSLGLNLSLSIRNIFSPRIRKSQSLRLQREPKNTPKRKSRYLKNARIFLYQILLICLEDNCAQNVLLCAVFLTYAKLTNEFGDKRMILLRATAVPVLLRAQISYGNSVRLSVCLGCHDPVPNQAQVR